MKKTSVMWEPFANVLQLLKLPDGTVKALIEGKTRASIARFVKHKDFFQVELEPVPETEVSPAEGEALVRSINKSFDEYAKINKNISKDLVKSVGSISDPSKLVDTVAAHFSFKIEDKQELLETISLEKRLSLLLSLIKMEIDIFKMDRTDKKPCQGTDGKDAEKLLSERTDAGHQERKSVQRMITGMSLKSLKSESNEKRCPRKPQERLGMNLKNSR